MAESTEIMYECVYVCICHDVSREIVFVYVWCVYVMKEWREITSVYVYAYIMIESTEIMCVCMCVCMCVYAMTSLEKYVFVYVWCVYVMIVSRWNENAVTSKQCIVSILLYGFTT